MATNPWVEAAANPPKPTGKLRPVRSAGSVASESRANDDIPANSYADKFLSGTGTSSFAKRFEESRRRREQRKQRAEAAATKAEAELKGPDVFPEDKRLKPSRSQALPEEMAEEPAEAVTPPPPKRLLQHVLARRAATDEMDLPALSRATEGKVRSNGQELSLIEGYLTRVDRGVSSIYISSCFDREGKSTAALMAAYGLASIAERPVLLTETNVDSPMLGRLFGIDDSPGLQEVMLGEAALRDAILPTAYENLYVLPAGEGRVALHDPRFKEVLDTLGHNFDFTIIDGKSAMSSSEPVKVAGLMGGVMIVVECEKTKWEVVQLVHERLAGAGAPRTGVILNKRKFYVPRLVYNLMSRH